MSTERLPVSRMDSTYGGTQRVLIEVADVLGHKWHQVILHRLLNEGALTFSGLQSGIDEVSNKMLSDSLSALESRGLVDRDVVNEKPVRVQYTLTDRGRELEAVLDPMMRWGREHLTDGASRPTTESTATRGSPRSTTEGAADE